MGFLNGVWIWSGAWCLVTELLNDRKRILNFETNSLNMGAKADKSELLKWLNEMDDPGMLAAMLLYKRTMEEGDPIAYLSPSHLASIDRGLEDLKQGRVKPSASVWKKHGL